MPTTWYCSFEEIWQRVRVNLYMPVLLVVNLQENGETNDALGRGDGSRLVAVQFTFIQCLHSLSKTDASVNTFNVQGFP